MLVNNGLGLATFDESVRENLKAILPGGEFVIFKMATSRGQNQIGRVEAAIQIGVAEGCANAVVNQIIEIIDRQFAIFI